MYNEERLETQGAIVRLAKVLSRKERHLDEARLLYQRAQKRLWTIEQDLTNSLWSAYVLNATKTTLGDLDKAENILKETLRLSEARLSERYRIIRLCKMKLAEIQQTRGEYETQTQSWQEFH